MIFHENATHYVNPLLFLALSLTIATGCSDANPEEQIDGTETCPEGEILRNGICEPDAEARANNQSANQQNNPETNNVSNTPDNNSANHSTNNTANNTAMPFDPNWSVSNLQIGDIPAVSEETDMECADTGYLGGIDLFGAGAAQYEFEALPGQIVTVILSCIVPFDELTITFGGVAVEAFAISPTSFGFTIPGGTASGDTEVVVRSEFDETSNTITVLESPAQVENARAYLEESIDIIRIRLDAMEESTNRSYALKALEDASAELDNLNETELEEMALLLSANPQLFGLQENLLCQIMGSSIDRWADCFQRQVVTNLKLALGATVVIISGVALLSTPAAPVGILAVGIAIASIAAALADIADDALLITSRVIAVIAEQSYDAIVGKETVIESGVPFLLGASADFVNFAGMPDDFLKNSPAAEQVLSVFGRARDIATRMEFLFDGFPLDPTDADPTEERHDIDAEYLDVSASQSVPPLPSGYGIRQSNCPGYEDRIRITVPDSGSFPVQLAVSYQGVFSSQTQSVDVVVKGGASSSTLVLSGLWEETITNGSQVVSRTLFDFLDGSGSINCHSRWSETSEPPGWYPVSGGCGNWEIATAPSSSGPGVFCYTGFLYDDVLYEYTSTGQSVINGVCVSGTCAGSYTLRKM